MLAALLGDEPELEPLKRLIADRTEGNPFFVEETVQALFEQGVIARNGKVTLKQSLGSIKIPATIEALLASRIDRLPPDEKALLQSLAVIGREFTLPLIRQIAGGSEAELERMMGDLQRREFIYEQPAFPYAEYTLKHALTQGVTYNSILGERRKQLHERAGQAIESLFATNLADYFSDLARHYSRSGNGLRAANYLQLAAHQAMDRGAYAEARAGLTRGLELLGSQPNSSARDQIEIAARLKLAMCLQAMLIEGSEIISVLQQARELCERGDDDFGLFEVLSALNLYYNYAADHQMALTIDQQMLSVAERTDDVGMIASALDRRGFSLLYQGDFTGAERDFEHIYNLPLDATKKVQALLDWRIQSRAERAMTLWMLGFPERAVRFSEESVALGREIGSPYNYSAALWWSIELELLRGNWLSALLKSEEAIHQADKMGVQLHGFRVFHGWALAQQGQPELGLSEILQHKADVAQLQGVFLSWWFMPLVNVYLVAGRQSEGLAAVDEGLKFIERTGTRFNEAEMRRLKGELFLRDGNNEGAAHCFRQAIEIALQQSAKSWELRATMSLARLLARQGHSDEARTTLADIYGWFTEGFDTGDLKDAKALLDELSN
jgi:tetratricopeptide (TPR) repeat protein